MILRDIHCKECGIEIKNAPPARKRCAPCAAQRVRTRPDATTKNLYPLQYRAQQAVYAARRRGEIVRPEACQRCGNSEKPPHAHHHDYLKVLEVEDCEDSYYISEYRLVGEVDAE